MGAVSVFTTGNQMFIKDVLRNFLKITGKQPCRSLFLNKVAGIYYKIFKGTFIKKEFLAQMYSSEFFEIFKNTFLIEHLRTTAFLFSVCYDNAGERFEFWQFSHL